MTLRITLACLLTVCTVVRGQVAEDIRELQVTRQQTPLAFPTRAEAPPTIDGKLDDTCWQNAVRLEPMRVASSGAIATEGAVTRVCYDDRAIYVAVDAEEGQIDHLTGTEQRGREDAWGGDEIELFIAPHGDGRYYQFAVGPKFGQRLDFSSDESFKYHNTEWQSAVNLDRDRGRAIIEVSIPYTAFGFDAPPRDTVWGFNIGRQNNFTESPSEAWANLPSQELSQWSPTGLTFRNAALFGRLYFGSRDAFAARRSPLDVQLVLDRYQYDNFDGDAQAVVSVRTGGRERDALSTTLTLSRDGKQLKEQNLGTPQADSIAMLMPIDGLQPGTYTVTATTTAPDAKPATATWTFDRIDVAAPPREGRIALKMPQFKDPWPIRTGVPLPKGALDDPAHVRLLVDGQPHPCQTSIRGRWSPRGSIRWLGLTFIAHDSSATYELQYGTDPGPAPGSSPQQPVTINNNTIDTGPLRVTFDRRGITGATLNGKTVVTEAAPPYIIDDSGTRYTATGDDISVEIEEAGPVHAVVRVSGWFSSGDEKLCKFTTYYEAFAGLPHVFVDHAVVITYDTTQNKLRDIGFPVAAAGEGYAIGIDGNKSLSGTQRDRRVTAVQDRWDHFKVTTEGAHEGEKLDSWASAGNVTLTAQYMPQRFPKSFTIDGDALTYHLFPADLGDTFSDEEELAYHNIYKLFSAHEGPALDLNMPKAYFDKGREYKADNLMFSLGYTQAGVRISNGQGVAINEPFMLTFGECDGGKLADLFERDPNAIADPQWIEQTGVFGPFASVDRDGFPQIAQYMGRALLALCMPTIEASKAYGMFNFGDVHTYFDPFNEPPKALVHRVWLNHHHGQNPLPWWLYAYYGEPQYLQWARINSHHTMNVDICHYVDEDNPPPYHKLGGFYHVKGFVHWGGDAGIAHHLISTQYLQWAWAMTGKRRARDVLHEWVEGITRESPDGYGTREGSTALGEITGYYMNHFDPAMLPLMHDFAVACNKEPYESQGAFNWNPATMLRYYELTHDPVALQRMKSPKYYADEAPQIGGYLYLLTGDKQYLAHYDDLYEQLGTQFDALGDHYDGYTWYSFLGLGRQIPTLLVAQKAFAKAGRRVTPDLDVQRPVLVETGPVSRDSPQDYTLGVMKTGNTPITIEVDGDVVETIPADAPTGLHLVHVASNKPAKVSGAEPFFHCKAGEEYGLLQRSLARITPIDGDGPITLTFRVGDKRPARVTVINDDGDIVAEASNFLRLRHEQSTLSIPAGGPYRIVAPQMITFTPDRNVRIDLHSGTTAARQTSEPKDE